jgi:hypothetical protein
LALIVVVWPAAGRVVAGVRRVAVELQPVMADHECCRECRDNKRSHAGYGAVLPGAPVIAR